MSTSKTATCIQMAMAKSNISAAELGEKMGVVPSTVSRWRQKGSDSVAILAQIAVVCDMSVTELMEIAD